MKTTLDLPDDLVKEVKLRAVHEGKKLKDAVAELLRKALVETTTGSTTVLRTDKSMLKRRGELTRKFVSGEWGVELAGYEPAKEVDQKTEARRSKAWRR